VFLAIGIAVATPFLVPLVRGFIILPYIPRPWDSLSLLAIAGIWIWSSRRLVRKTHADSFRADRVSLIILLLGLIAFSAGYAGSVWCFYHHLCMDGHMAHPELLTNGDYWFDAFWSGLVLLAVTLAVISRTRWAFMLIIAGVFLLFYRFALGGFGGMFSLPL